MSAEDILAHFDMMSSNIKPIIINQRGHGIGGSQRGRMMYKIQTGGAGGTVVSPVQQALEQAKQGMNIKRKRSRSRSHSSHSRSTSRTGRRRRRRSRKRKTKKTSRSRSRSRSGKRRPRKSGKTATTKKKKKRRGKHQDIFSQ
jgi:hypothetical protein